MFARRKRTVPQLNATSTADISFMLLIFFLVTTSMDLDKGLGKKLPPVEKSKQEESLVHKDNIIKVFITADNKNAITSTFNQLKNQLAVKMFHHSYALCSVEEKDEVNRLMPQRMVEAVDNNQINNP